MLSFSFIAISVVFIANFYFLINKVWELSKSRDTAFDLYEKKFDHKANKTSEDRDEFYEKCYKDWKNSR